MHWMMLEGDCKCAAQLSRLDWGELYVCKQRLIQHNAACVRPLKHTWNNAAMESSFALGTHHLCMWQKSSGLTGQAFEEILHGLPQVKTLKLILCGPQLLNLMKLWSSEVMVMDTCSDCRSKSHAHIHEHHHKLYHELGVQSALENSDLAVAFNSGLSKENAGTWPDMIKFLVKRKVP
ncbi:uncharacterized protein EV420DRAFT_1673514 [Desarmillaria tabescens]|uniref:Mitochondrial splicing suppressor 51-like C-terminal domain-containing protein n=1 Tax=Armillaria tabescens TaxID=1929756 RepID=A0AA39J4U7_ARMTA|nr:uncharacterized protein EV420DRAFT_1673514 [Desarmillaria tabescens]KAK0436180.1 hypothetical protein EV420DRAFT_1673514 [Desarmillaria tabescens]